MENCFLLHKQSVPIGILVNCNRNFCPHSLAEDALSHLIYLRGLKLSSVITTTTIITTTIFMVLSSWLKPLREHLVHVMNMAWRQAAADPQTGPNNLGCESAWRAARNHTHHHHLLLLLSPKADTHFTILRRVEGWVVLGTAVRVCSPCPRLYIVVKFTINMQLPTVIFEPWSSHTAARHVAARPLRPATVTVTWNNCWQDFRIGTSFFPKYKDGSR